jgi:acyl-coenzyme A thioesterase PaaI-like protein
LNQPIQNFYPEKIAVCYGCGRLNEHGLHVKTYWDGEVGNAVFNPKPYHTAFPGFVYGGLIASIIDCHACGTAAAAAYDHEGRSPGTAPDFRFVTGTLNIKFLRPTPMDTDLNLRATVREYNGRKMTVDVTLSAQDEVRATGEVIVFQMPDELMPS